MNIILSTFGGDSNKKEDEDLSGTCVSTSYTFKTHLTRPKEGICIVEDMQCCYGMRPFTVHKYSCRRALNCRMNVSVQNVEWSIKLRHNILCSYILLTNSLLRQSERHHLE